MSDLSVATAAASAAAAQPAYSFITLFLSGAALNLWNAIPWVMIFLALRFLSPVRLYVLNEKEVCRRIQKRVSFTSHVSDSGKAYGYAVGYWFFMDISIHSDDGCDRYTIWMIATETTYKALSADSRDLAAASSASSASSPASSGSSPGPTSKSEVETKPLEILERDGSFHNCWFRPRKVHRRWTPTIDQAAIIADVKGCLKKNKHCVLCLYGTPGSGKSMVGLLLAQELGGKYCNTLKPWQPGDKLTPLYAEAEPNETSPLVVAFDEFDAALINIHAGVIPSHKHLPIAIQNKQGWNDMFDEISRGTFEHLIVVLTTNKTPSFFDELDPAYLREGRVDLIRELANRKKVD
jgi:hypothetical protein